MVLFPDCDKLSVCVSLTHNQIDPSKIDLEDPLIQFATERLIQNDLKEAGWISEEYHTPFSLEYSIKNTPHGDTYFCISAVKNLQIPPIQ